MLALQWLLPSHRPLPSPEQPDCPAPTLLRSTQTQAGSSGRGLTHTHTHTHCRCCCLVFLFPVLVSIPAECSPWGSQRAAPPPTALPQGGSEWDEEHSTGSSVRARGQCWSCSHSCFKGVGERPGCSWAHVMVNAHPEGECSCHHHSVLQAGQATHGAAPGQPAGCQHRAHSSARKAASLL